MFESVVDSLGKLLGAAKDIPVEAICAVGLVVICCYSMHTKQQQNGR